MNDKEKLEAIEEVIDADGKDGRTKELILAHKDLLTAWNKIRKIVKED